MKANKQSPKNFEESQLPDTRKKQFGDILKLRYRTLMFIGLMLLLFFLPILLCILYRDTSQINIIQKYEGEELANQLIFSNLLFSWLLIPSIMIFSLGVAGSLKIIRRLIWGEPVFLKEDFSTGIKENWKGYLLVSFIGGVLNAANTLIVSFLPSNNFLTYLPLIALLVLFYPIIFVFAFYNVVYSDKIGKNLINSLKLYFRSVFITFLFCLLCYSMILIKYIPSILKYFLAGAIIIFVIPIFLLMFYEYEIHIFDKYINSYQYPQFVRRGLYTKPGNQGDYKMELVLKNLVCENLVHNTETIQTAIDKASSSGGGKVIIPSGEYHIKTIFLKSNVCLFLKKGCTLIGSTNIKDYGYSSLEIKYACDVGNVVPEHYFGLIIIEDANNASICGEGIIDGMGKYLEHFPNPDDPTKSRPFLVMLYKSKDFYIEGVTLKDSGMYAFYSMQSDNIHVKGIKIRTLDSINGDGIDFDGGKNILIEDCDIESSDDSISTKTYTKYPIQNVVVRNCKMKSNWAAVRVGTESAGDMEDILIENCDFRECRDGVKIQLCGPGNYRRITFKNIHMKDVLRPFFITLSKFRLSLDEGFIVPESGVINDLKFENIDILDTGKTRVFQNNHQRGMYEQKALFISGYYNNFISNVSFDNINIKLHRSHSGPIRYDIPEFIDVFEQYPEISHAEGELPASIFYIRNVQNLKMNHVSLSIEGDDNRPSIFFNHVNGELTDISFDSNMYMESIDSNIESPYPLETRDERILDSVRINLKEYFDYLNTFLPFIKQIEESDKTEVINIDEFIAPEDGEYLIQFNKLMGEADIMVGNSVVAKHRYAGDYKLNYCFAFSVNLKKGDTIKVSFINPNDLLGHHGVIEPMYGPQYSEMVKILKL